MNIYHDIILDHYRNPRNHGTLEKPTHKGEAKNPTCGDELRMDILIENDTIVDVRWRGAGCAISQASASLLTENVKEKVLKDTLSLTPEDILKLLGVPLSPNRLKCGLLSLETLKRTLALPQ